MNRDHCHVYFLQKINYPVSIDINSVAHYFDEQELARYHRFTADKARHNFVIGRLLVKSAIAQIAGLNVEAIRFAYSKAGKPYLVNNPELHFSLSHCGSAVAVALAWQNLGMDAEDTARAAKLCPTAELYINSRLAQKIADTDVNSGVELFNLHWTCLEGLVKLKDSTIFKERVALTLDIADILQNPLQLSGEQFAVWSCRPVAEFRLSVVTDNPLGSYLIREVANIDQFATCVHAGLTETERLG